MNNKDRYKFNKTYRDCPKYKILKRNFKLIKRDAFNILYK